MLVQSEDNNYQVDFSFDNGDPDDDLGHFSGNYFSTYDNDNDQSGAVTTDQRSTIHRLCTACLTYFLHFNISDAHTNLKLAGRKHLLIGYVR